MLITLSGLSGSGKSSTAKAVSEALGIPTVDVGGIFRAKAAEHGMDVMAFGRYVAEHPEIDRELDDEMIEEARRQPDLILQARLAGWMTYKREVPAMRIWLETSEEERARRVSGREGISPEQALADLRLRDSRDRERYLGLYGLDVNDISVYDVVIRTDNLGLAEVTSAVINSINAYGRRNAEQSAGSSS
jgi:predicted cytidylate kinase